MCGIAGIFNLNGEPVAPDMLRNMTDAIAHRGPDSEGFYIDSFIGLGHRRLSIIDLSRAGHQPMLSRDGRVAISYNGEVYNFKELRAELEKLGHQFVSRTDTEIVLNSYLEWGHRCLDRFNGMFAFVIWDKKYQELFVARDRYGIKPLYYTFSGSKFLFASEQKSIISCPDIKRAIDHEALLEYFTFQNIFTDKTLLKDIKLFPPGSYAVLQLGQMVTDLNPKQYWDYHFAEPTGPVDSREYRQELDRLLKQAVKRQIVSDVELGSYLSGGMDSGTLTALAARELPFIKTFTCGFDLSSASGIELGFDERVKAEAMSALFKTEHYEMVLKAGDMERCLPRLTRHIEEPRVGQCYPNYYTAQLAGKFVKVVLSGAGGDELFGGYPWRYYRATACDDIEDYIDQYYVYWQRLIPNTVIAKVFAPIWDKVKHVWTRDIFRDVLRGHDNHLERPEDYINHSLYFEAKTFLHGLFIIEDKLSMAHGLETRVPFMDNNIVDFAMRCPVSMKLNNLNEKIRIDENEPGRKTQKYFQKTRDGKCILREVMRRYIPENITNAKKQGFSAPDASWFKGESIDFVKSTLLNPKNDIFNLMDFSAVSALMHQHLSGQKNHRLLIWSLLNLSHWLDGIKCSQ